MKSWLISFRKAVAVVLTVVQFEAQRTQLAFPFFAYLVVEVLERCVEHRYYVVDVLCYLASIELRNFQGFVIEKASLSHLLSIFIQAPFLVVLFKALLESHGTTLKVCDNCEDV